MNLIPILEKAKTIWLSTHKSADGDGLGSEIALFHALISQGYNVQIIHNDLAPERYNFITENIVITDSNSVKDSDFSNNDVALIFDTHDPKLCAPLFDLLTIKNIQIIYIDHHIVFEAKNVNNTYIIDEKASCTGEIVFHLIKKMGIEISAKVATALYTSLIFDTQNFKTMRDPVKIFEMAKELIQSGADHNFIYDKLFNNWTIGKLNYLSQLIKTTTFINDKVALLYILKTDLEIYNLSSDDVCDLVDLFMTTKSLEVSVVIREENINYHKLSFRSRSGEILSWAQQFGGGGHLYSAGAWVEDSASNILKKIHQQITEKM